MQTWSNYYCILKVSEYLEEFKQFYMQKLWNTSLWMQIQVSLFCFPHLQMMQKFWGILKSCFPCYSEKAVCQQISLKLQLFLRETLLLWRWIYRELDIIYRKLLCCENVFVCDFLWYYSVLHNLIQFSHSVRKHFQLCIRWRSKTFLSYLDEGVL